MNARVATKAANARSSGQPTRLASGFRNFWEKMSRRYDLFLPVRRPLPVQFDHHVAVALIILEPDLVITGRQADFSAVERAAVNAPVIDKLLVVHPKAHA